MMPLAVPSSAEALLTSTRVADTAGDAMFNPIRGTSSADLGVALVAGSFFELACSNLRRTFSMTFSGRTGLLNKAACACIYAEQIFTNSLGV